MSLLDVKPGGLTSITFITEYEGWCSAPNKQKLLVGDWNGDGFTDLLCHNQTGEMKIFINQGRSVTYTSEVLQKRRQEWFRCAIFQYMAGPQRNMFLRPTLSRLMESIKLSLLEFNLSCKTSEMNLLIRYDVFISRARLKECCFRR